MTDLLTDPYIAELRAMHAQVDSILSRLEREHSSPVPASPSRDAPLIPSSGLAGAGDLSTAPRSGQATPSPADTAARGTYSEEIA